jgi:phosphoglycolate phosphatase
MKYAGFTEEEAEQAIRLYRERYTTVGLFENAVYDGVEDMLKNLKEGGYVLAVASSKPEVFVKQILEYFHLDHYFTEMVGSELNGGRSRKSEVVEEALLRLGLQDDREHVLMVGDKEHDVFGAREAGMNCVAVTWGYGTAEELAESQPMLTVDYSDQLVKYLI